MKRKMRKKLQDINQFAEKSKDAENSLKKQQKHNETAALGFVSSLATSVTTYGMIGDMDRRGIVLNSAFAISAAFTFAGHLAFTMAFNADYLPAVILGKLTAASLALLVAQVMHKRIYK